MVMIEEFLREKQKEEWVENWKRHLKMRVKTVSIFTKIETILYHNVM